MAKVASLLRSIEFRRHMASDAWRSLVAGLISAAMLPPIEWVLKKIRGAEASLDIEISMMFLAFFLFGLAYVVLCYVAYDHLSADQLQQRLKATSTRHMQGFWRGLLTGGSGTTWAIFFSTIAVGTMLTISLLNTVPEIAEDIRISREIGLMTVVGAWFINAVSFAMHHAREDAEAGAQFEFPGGKAPRWSDYTNVAFQVSTTFATSDVACISTARRRLITRHTMLAFAFNTLIITQLVNMLR